MTNGLNIDLKSFKQLPRDQQLTVLYENTEVLKSMVRGYRFELWTHRVAILVLFVGVGFGKFLGII